MRYLKYSIIIIILFNTTILNAQDKNLESKITKNLRCLICQGQSIYDSDSEFAVSVKLLVKKKLNEDFNEEEIYSFLSDKYGEWILYDPQFNKNTYFLWLLPILMFLIGGAIILRVFIVNHFGAKRFTNDLVPRSPTGLTTQHPATLRLQCSSN